MNAPPTPAELGLPTRRKLKVTRASEMTVRPVHWTWERRVPVGVLTFLAGREGCGKSTVLYDRAAALTRGALPGQYLGNPKSVIVCAGEDSWEHTVLPRLMAADADLERVLRVEVEVEQIGQDKETVDLSLPADIPAVEQLAYDEDVFMIILDPLMSMLDAKMDSHKYHDVYKALRPLMKLAEDTSVGVVGILHLNKTAGGADPLTRMMASRAFATAPRSILMVHQDDSEAEEGAPDRYMLGHEKCNLGPKAPTLLYELKTTIVAQTEDGAVEAPQVVWQGETTRTVRDAMAEAEEGGKKGGPALRAAKAWLLDHLRSVGGEDSVESIKQAGEAAAHTYSTLQRARGALYPTVTTFRPGGNVGPYSWRLVEPTASTASDPVPSVPGLNIVEPRR